MSVTSNAARATEKFSALQLLFELLELGIVAAIDDHMRAGGCQGSHHGLTQMPARRGNERDAAIQPEHV